MAGKDQWDVKYLREQPFMAFGSMMNAYGQVNKGKDIPTEQFLEDVKKIFIQAMQLSEKTFNTYSKDSGSDVDFPIK